MSYLKNATNLQLGKAEMNRNKLFLDDEGWRLFFKNNMLTPGVVKNKYYDSAFLNGQVTIQDLVNFIIKIQSVTAVDSNGNYIDLTVPFTIQVPTQNTWYWVKIAFTTSNVEQGTFSIDTQGNVTGVSSALTQILRGMPNFASRVSFPNATLNKQEYDVIQVTSDTQAVLLGTNFQAESNLQLAVVGTFTPGINVPSQDKYPFVYDSCVITLVQESVANVAPPKISGTEFYLARVQARIDGGSTYVVEIQDKRTEILRMNDDFTRIGILQNEIVGIEQAKYQNDFTDKSKNDVRVGWGIRTNTWSVNDTLNQVFLSNGQGGLIKQISQTTPNQFVGWRLYSPKGEYSIITACIQSSGGLKVTVDSLNVDNFSNDGGVTTISDYIVIAPDTEEIEFLWTNNSSLDEYYFRFPIDEKYGICDVTIDNSASTQFTVKYRYKNVDQYTQWKLIADDVTNGYYNENQFDYTSGGLLPGAVYTTYQSGLITLLTANSGSFSVAIIALLSGFNEPLLLNGFGISNVNPSLSTLTIAAGVAFINGAIVRTNTYNGTYPAYLNQQGQYSLVQPGGSFISFDPYTSQYFDDVSKRHTTKAYELIELEQVDQSMFDNTGKGKWIWLGFAKCNGNNGTEDRAQTFAMGADESDNTGNFGIGDAGGVKQVTIGQTNLPPVQLELLTYQNDGSVYVHDTSGGGSAFSLKNDSDNNPLVPGPIKTTPLNGNASQAAVPMTITPKYKTVVILQRLPN